jgi:hypothetical protein
MMAAGGAAAMQRNAVIFGFLALAAASFAAFSASEAAVPAAGIASADQTHALAAQTRRRPRVIIRPRRVRPGPNSQRICRSWLVEEYRPSGTVIVPQMRCWWEP